MKTFIFLDIDGVLNKSSQWKQNYSLNESCIKEFSRFVKAINGNVILISSWRNGFISTFNENNLPHIKKLEVALAKYHIKIEAKTPVLPGRSRNKEIERYLYFNPCGSYIIIDDDKSEYDVVTKHNHFVNADTGFSNNDRKECLKCI